MTPTITAEWQKASMPTEHDVLVIETPRGEVAWRVTEVDIISEFELEGEPWVLGEIAFETEDMAKFRARMGEERA